jgi:transcriptional regulator with XRE-family HTH domain
MHMKNFAKTIKEMREAKKMLLREVAAKMNVDSSLLSRVEHGMKRLSREQVVALAAALGQDEEKLLVLYLGERVVYELKDEEDLAIDAIMVAEKLIRYTGKNQKTKRQGGATDFKQSI